MSEESMLQCDMDLDSPGKRSGHITVSQEAVAGLAAPLRLPIGVINGGPGPTVLVMGGNHGDEYEGPLTVAKLLRELEPGQLRGRVICLPVANPPAHRARLRESPVDGLNMNRIWPGSAQGSLTEKLVHYIDSVLLPRCDVFMDLHTGGTAMKLIPMTMSVYTDDTERADQAREAVLAFNAPLNVEILLGPGKTTASWRAAELGKLVVGTETGGGESVTGQSLGVTERGVRNVLAHLGMMEAAQTPSPPITRLTRKHGFASELATPEAGIFEAFHDLWEEVSAGQPAGLLHFPETPLREPLALHYPDTGLLAGRRSLGGVSQGDVLYWLVQDV